MDQNHDGSRAGRVALVTGGGRRRLGAHVAEALAARGYHVAVHYHTSAAEAQETVHRVRQYGVRAECFAADVTSEQAVRALVEAVRSQFGRLDALVTCAAIWQRQPLEATTAADVLEHFRVNALGTFLCAQHAGLAMVGQSDGGAIITFGDWAEVRPYRDYAAYFASKGAVTALTRALAVELAARNPRIRVNCILPGPAMLPEDLPADERAAAIAGTLVQREGTPASIAQAVLHFLENEFVTGVCLPVDGGRTIYAPDSLR